MLRISESALTEVSQPHYLSIDKKKRQITLTDPTTSAASSSAASQERGPKVAAPKIFAFDNLFTDEDAQCDVTASALSEVIPAVLEGTDGCLLTLGYAESGMWKINIFYAIINHLVWWFISFFLRLSESTQFQAFLFTLWMSIDFLWNSLLNYSLAVLNTSSNSHVLIFFFRSIQNHVRITCSSKRARCYTMCNIVAVQRN